MSKILVIGSQGQLGYALARALSGLGDVVAVGRETIDLSRPDSIRKSLREIRPGLIVNAAAYTAVDKAEQEPELAIAINGIAPGILAEEAKRLSAPLVHYSTDYVFDGSKIGPYTEENPTKPLNAYGRSKLHGEEAVQAIDFPHLILRTSWVYGPRGGNFMLTILRLARERRELKVVNDQWGAPTSSAFLAMSTAAILQRLHFGGLKFSDAISDARGVYHLTAAGKTTWFGFATAIVTMASQPDKVAKEFFIENPAIVLPIPSEQYPFPTPRPRNSVMANDKLRSTFCLEAQPWENGLEECMAGNRFGC